jgi:hypothetical protein
MTWSKPDMTKTNYDQKRADALKKLYQERMAGWLPPRKPHSPRNIKPA